MVPRRWNSARDRALYPGHSACCVARSPRPRAFFFAKAISGSRPMTLIISLLITFLVVILVLYLINMLPIDARAKQIARVIVIIIGVVSLLRLLPIV
jgi:hypothetical protein